MDNLAAVALEYRMLTVAQQKTKQNVTTKSILLHSTHVEFRNKYVNYFFNISNIMQGFGRDYFVLYCLGLVPIVPMQTYVLGSS